MCFARSPFAPVFLLAALAIGGALSADQPNAVEPPLVDEPIRRRMQDRDYPAAIKAIEIAAQNAEAPRDYLTYLKGRALMLQKEYAAAVEVFETLQKKFPQSEWSRRARFAAAVTLARSGDFRGAEQIYRAEAESLFSAGRKQQMADVFLEFADVFFKPADKDKAPDYGKAREFYRKALDMGIEPARRADVELRVAQCLQEERQYREAGRHFERFVEDHPDSPLVVEAWFRLGECRLDDGQRNLARWAWQDLLTKHKGTKSERIADAMFHLARTWNVPEPANDGELGLGVAALDKFLDRYGDHKLASRAHLDVARSYFHRKQYDVAVARLVQFLADERFADAEEIPAARNLLGEAYEAQKKYPEAIAAWRDYLVHHPAHEDWSEVQRQVITAEALLAGTAFKAKRYDEARRLFAQFMAKYPLDKRQPHILYMLGQMHFEEKKWDEAIAQWRRLISKYPRSDEASDARLAIARTLEEEQGVLEEALKQYREVDSWTGVAAEAYQAVARLTGKTMKLATERVFRSDEMPRVRLTTRNVDKVSVRAYRIDLEAYFRKMHAVRGIEKLDISLIDPDGAFDYELPDYEKYREFDNQVDVSPAGNAGGGDAPEAGATAVTVAGDTLEATTLLIRSDLDIIVKSSREELLVFAQNMRTGKPWPGVKLLISNGSQVFAEAATGKDGVWRAAYDDLPAPANVVQSNGSHRPTDVRVFAVADGHVASGQMSLRDIGVARSLTDKGYIDTDRPIYRAGQTVHIRGCIRRADNNAYVIDEDTQLTLDVLDSRDRSIWQQQVTLGRFGTFHADCQLPQAAREGRYRLAVRGADGNSYHGEFQVREHRVEPVRLIIDVPRTVYYRGETIEGVIRAEHYYGMPLANCEIHYQLEDGRSHSTRTDAHGDASFRVHTDDYPEGRGLSFTVELPGRNVEASTEFRLATQGFSMRLSTLRKVFLAGEPFEVTAATRDAQDRAVGRKLKLKVFERTDTDGETDERFVDEHPLETDPDDGRARITLKLDKGGQYLLRIEGKDRFGNTISHERPIQISDDDDKVRLRILCDKSMYKVGETADITVHWREAPALALVTFEGARVLDYQLMKLNKGANRLQIPMTSRRVPSFKLNVAVMVDRREPAAANEPNDDGSRFHTASTWLTAARDLDVELAVRRKDGANEPVRPGDQVEVTVTTTDSAGKPASAELSLAMVEKAAAPRFAGSEGPPAAIFQPQRWHDTDPFGGSSTDPFGKGGGEKRPIKLRLTAKSETTRHPLIPPVDETGYWNPAVVTGEDGKATVTFVVPDRNTVWRLLAQAVTVETQAGQAIEELVARKELFGELHLPTAFVDGDRAEIIATVRNDLVEKGRIEVRLKTTVAGRTTEVKRQIDVQAKGDHELRFPMVLNYPATEDSLLPRVQFELTVATGNRTDTLRRAVPVKPFGMPVRVAAGGVITSNTTVSVEPPGQYPLASPSLRILVSPTVEQSLVDIVLGSGSHPAGGTRPLDTPLATATSDLMAALSLLGPLAVKGEQARLLSDRVRSSISLLVSMQNNDGGFSFSGRGGESSPLDTARAVWALSLARQAGHRVPDATYRGAVKYLQGQTIMTANADYETTAILLHALAAAGRGDFAVANRLHRSRTSLSAAALAYVALAFVEMDRKATAAELVEVLKTRDLDAAGANRDAPLGCLRWSQSPVELRALTALAIQSVTPQADEAKELIEWLLAHRTGSRFVPDKATGPAAMALCRWYGQNHLRRAADANAPAPRPAPRDSGGEGRVRGGEASSATRLNGEKYGLTVLVNSKQVKVLEIDPTAGTQVIDVPTGLLAEGKQRIDFRLTGRGRSTYQCILSGFVPAEELSANTDAWQVERTYQPAPLEVDGREIPRGFQPVQGKAKTFHNPLTQLAIGRRGLVEIKLLRTKLAQNPPTGRLEYLVVTEPIPSGTTVLEPSISGPIEHYEIGPGAITFYVGNDRRLGTVRYELLGGSEGSYRAGPTVVRNVHRPDEFALSRPAKLAVLPRDAQSQDPYRLTPQELFELGRLYFEKREFGKAGKHLAELAGNWNLKPDVYKRAIEMLSDVHLQTGSAAGIVRYFEIIRENWPHVEIPFDDVLAIGAAYQEVGEFERSYLVFRAAVEGRFKQESTVAGFLQGQGELLRSVDVMSRLLQEYPPEGYVAQATQGLAQTVYVKAAQAEQDEKLRTAKVTREDLIRRAWRLFEAFLTDYPDNPSADRAAFAAATALLELKDYAAAAAACNRYAKRYPVSELLDTFWYVIGYCHFARSEHEAALEMCRKVAEHKRTDRWTGRQIDSKNKWQAVYILGQVYHSLGRPAEAIEQYGRVADRFADARQSIAYFNRKAIRLPEISTFLPDEPVQLELTFRNVPDCDVKVYRIDLMKFGRPRRSVRGVADVNLAGIYPLHETTVELGDGRDYRDRTRQLDLPLKKEGAYLVVARGGDLHASGLVLMTPLTLEVEEDTITGSVRITVKDRTDDRYVRDVSMKVIGSGSEEVVSGESDLRGVFVADDVCGAVTVVARALDDDQPARYAFYRGRTILQTGKFLYRTSGQQVTDLIAGGESAGVSLADESEAEKRIAATLASATRLEFIETPLLDVVDYLKKLHDIEIQVDNRALEDVGIGSDTPITRSLKGISLRNALRLMLRELDLTYVVRDDVLLITTPEEAECQLLTKVYPVADLVRYRDEKDAQWADFDTLIELVTSTVAPTTWCDAGGAGSIDGVSFNDADVLVLSQTDEVHEEIEDLLAQFRSVAPRKEGEPPPLSRAPVGANPYTLGGGLGGNVSGSGGGMGGFGGLPGQRPFVTSVIPVDGQLQHRAGVSGSGDLLQGLQDTHRGLQNQQVEQMQQMYKGGGGMGGGGGGLGAGGMF